MAHSFGSVPPAGRGNLQEGVVQCTRFGEVWFGDWYNPWVSPISLAHLPDFAGWCAAAHGRAGERG
jgi:hypothetical protein